MAEKEDISGHKRKVEEERNGARAKKIRGFLEPAECNELALTERELMSTEDETVVRSLAVNFPEIVRGPAGQKALLRAALAGNIALATALLEANVNPNGRHARNRKGGTPLHNAAFGGHTRVVAALIRAGIHLNVVAGRAGITALHLAAAHGHMETVRALLEGGANFAITDHLGHFPICYAHEYSHFEVAEFMIRYSEINGVTLMHEGYSATLP